MYQEQGPKISLAIDKGHNILRDEASFLERAGFNIAVWENGSLHTVVIDDTSLRGITQLRGGDIPYRLVEGVNDFGILGRDILREAQLDGLDIEEVVPLAFSRCIVAVEVPVSSTFRKPEDLNRMRIATSYPNQAEAFFALNNTEIKLVRYSGGEEGAPASGAADAVVAIYHTGYTAEINGLRLLNTPKDSTILESEAVLTASSEFLNEHGSERTVRQFIARFSQTAGRRTIRRVPTPLSGVQNLSVEGILIVENLAPQIALQPVNP